MPKVSTNGHSQNGRGLPFSSAPTTDQLKATINQEHDLVIRSARATVDHARRAGEHLLDLKRRIRHGQFTNWLKAEFVGSPETARCYMRIAKAWPRILAEGMTQGSSLEQLKKFLAPPKRLVQSAKQPPFKLKPPLDPPDSPDPTPPPRIVQLTLEPDDEEFDEMVAALQTKFETNNVTETIYESVQFTYREQCDG